MGLAVCIQIVSVGTVVAGYIQGKRRSSIHLVPVILWYVALVVRGSPFFFESELIELSIVFTVHLLITVALSLINYAGQRRGA